MGGTSLAAVLLEQLKNATGGISGLQCYLLNALQKEPQPAEPIAL